MQRTCCAMQWLNSQPTLERLSMGEAAHMALMDELTVEPRFPRNIIFDDVSEAIAKVRPMTFSMSGPHILSACQTITQCIWIRLQRPVTQ
jgi:hypothetical protein